MLKLWPRRAVVFARKLGLSSIILEGDSEVIIHDALRTEADLGAKTKIDYIVLNTKLLLINMNHIIFFF